MKQGQIIRPVGYEGRLRRHSDAIVDAAVADYESSEGSKHNESVQRTIGEGQEEPLVSLLPFGTTRERHKSLRVLKASERSFPCTFSSEEDELDSPIRRLLPGLLRYSVQLASAMAASNLIYQLHICGDPSLLQDPRFATPGRRDSLASKQGSSTRLSTSRTCSFVLSAMLIAAPPIWSGTSSSTFSASQIWRSGFTLRRVSPETPGSPKSNIGFRTLQSLRRST